MIAQMKRLSTFIMAGGKGQRLLPLTRDRAKPAVPFGGVYRIIDFTLSNCINSGIRRINILTQYKSDSLNRHLRMGWNMFPGELDEYINVLPAQQRVGDRWYQGTADALFQNIYTIRQERPEQILILAGDHVYKMDYARMLARHIETRADVTVGVVEMHRSHASQLGVLEVDREGRILGFEEKPARPRTLPGSPDRICASMGIYLFRTGVLLEELERDAGRLTEHDFGKNIFPDAVGRKRLFAYRFGGPAEEEEPYWRDIGTLDAYYEANMDLVSVSPRFNLYDDLWPVRTFQPQLPPAKTVFADPGEGARRGEALDSILSCGCIVSGGSVVRSVLSPKVRVNSYARVENAVLMDEVEVGRHARIRNAIIDKYVKIPPGTEIGYDRAEDAKRFHVTDRGIVVIPRGGEVIRKEEEERPGRLPAVFTRTGPEEVFSVHAA